VHDALAWLYAQTARLLARPGKPSICTSPGQDVAVYVTEGEIVVQEQ
jgi:hypothetical protein